MKLEQWKPHFVFVDFLYVLNVGLDKDINFMGVSVEREE